MGRAAVGRVSAILAAVTLTATPTEAQVTTMGGAELEIGGELHTQYALSSVDGAVDDVFLRRARLKLDVTVNDLVDGRLQPDFAGGGTTLRDAYLRLSFDPAFRISFGQFKRAFSVFELSSSTDVPLVERDGRIDGLDVCPGVGRGCTFSRLTEALGFDGRDTGVRVAGSFGNGVDYLVTLTNGEGINVPDANDAKSASGRVTVHRGVVTVGGFGAVRDHFRENDEGILENEFAGSGGIDVELGTWRSGMHVLGALVFGDNWRVGPDAGFWSVQGLASYYVPTGDSRVAGVEPLLRLSFADGNTDEDDDGGVLVTPGLMVYFAGKNGISANLDVYSPSGEDDTQWSLKVQSFLYF